MTTYSYSDIPVGAFFVSSTGFGANLSGRVMAKLVQWGTSSTVNHAGIYVGGGEVVEAQPGGARYAEAAQYLRENTRWDWSYLQSVEQGARIGRTAENMIGTPYGYLDIIAIAIAQRRFVRLFKDRIDTRRPWDEQPWWVKRLCRKDRLICSQLVDEAYRLNDIHLFTDGRLPQLVSPGDLLELIRDTEYKEL